jgi:hypothetical protein
LVGVDGGLHVGQVGVGDVGESRRRLGRQAELGGRRGDLSADERPRRRVRDDGGHPRLAGRAAQAEVTAQAPALQHQPLAVDVVALDDAVDHSPDDPLPGRDQRRAVLDEQLPRPGPSTSTTWYPRASACWPMARYMSGMLAS